MFLQILNEDKEKLKLFFYKFLRYLQLKINYVFVRYKFNKEK